MDIRKELGVNSIEEKVRGMKLRCYGHLQSMEVHNEVRTIVDMIMPGKSPKGRLRRRCIDCVRRDLQELRIIPEDAQDRTFWKSRIRAADLHLMGKGEEEKEEEALHFSQEKKQSKAYYGLSPSPDEIPQVNSYA